MTREQFIGMLRSPAVIDLNRVRDLEDITVQFPYFQNAHLLLARQYYGHENIRYDSHLKKASAYAPDRRVLYNLIHLPATDVVHMEAVKSETSVLEIQPETVIAEITRYVAPEEHPIPVEPLAKIFQPEIREEEKAISEPETTPLPVTAIDNTEVDPRAIIEQRLREIERQYLTVGSVAPKEDPKEILRPAIEDAKPISEKPVEEMPAAQPPVGNVSQPNQSSDMKMSFADWLKMKSVPVAPASDPKNYFGEVAAPKPQVPEKIQTEKSAETTKRPTSLHTEQIIEKFIQEEPRIEPSKSEFYSPGNMARKSLIEHDDLISETLAGIYARQGNKQKAIDMYLKLSLKFPEKSAYFATLIKNLEEEN